MYQPSYVHLRVWRHSNQDTTTGASCEDVPHGASLREPRPTDRQNLRSAPSMFLKFECSAMRNLRIPLLRVWHSRLRERRDPQGLIRGRKYGRVDPLTDSAGGMPQCVGHDVLLIFAGGGNGSLWCASLESGLACI